MDNHKDCIFILTCNYLNRVIEPLQSRCPPVSLQFAVSDIQPRVEHILNNESIEFSSEDLTNFMEKILPKFLPDIRTSVSVLQDCCSSGKLDTTTEIALIDGVDETCKYILSSVKEGQTPLQVREYLIKNSEKFSEDYLKLSSNLFNILCRTKISSSDLSNIGDIIFRIDQVIDKEIQFFVLISYLHNLITKSSK
jgi:replication factor C small subunit